MATVFISHPYAGNQRGNVDKVRRLARSLATDGDLPLAPHIYLPQFIDETTERELALRVCLAFVALADELRFFGEPTEGMRLEIAEARRLGIPVVAGDDQGAMSLTGEPPR